MSHNILEFPKLQWPNYVLTAIIWRILCQIRLARLRMISQTRATFIIANLVIEDYLSPEWLDMQVHVIDYCRIEHIKRRHLIISPQKLYLKNQIPIDILLILRLIRQNPLGKFKTCRLHTHHWQVERFNKQF